MKRTVPIASFPIMRALVKAGCTHGEVAEMFGCTRSNVTHALAYNKDRVYGAQAIEAAVRTALREHHKRRFLSVAKQLRELASQMERRAK
jgi:hypothetical protein